MKLSAALKEFRLLNTSAARAFNRLIFPDRMRLAGWPSSTSTLNPKP